MCESRKNIPHPLYPFGSQMRTARRGRSCLVVLSPDRPPIRHHVRVARGRRRFRHGHNVECNCACTTQRHARKSWREYPRPSKSDPHTITSPQNHRFTSRTRFRLQSYGCLPAPPLSGCDSGTAFGASSGTPFRRATRNHASRQRPSNFYRVATTFSRMPLVAIRIHVHT